MLNKLATSILILFTIVGTVFAQSPLLPGKLAIYYGWPSAVNSSGRDTDAATEVFNDYDIVVFGDGLQYESHDDHANTETIINNLKTSPNNTAVYGYIPIGVTTGNLPMAGIQNRVDAWHAMGVAGIFLDEAGYDYGVTRQRQNAVVDFVHNKELRVFINAWNPDHVFSQIPPDQLNPPFDHNLNPNGEGTHLGPKDIYLLESFQIVWNDFQDPAFWASKSDKAFNYKNQFGTRMATVTTMVPEEQIDYSWEQYHQVRFEYAWWSTLLYGFDFMGWGEPSFSSNSYLPFHTRPDPGEIGSDFTSPVIHDGDVHTRATTTGTIEVNTDTHIGEFTSFPPWVVYTPKGDEIVVLLWTEMVPIGVIFKKVTGAGSTSLTTSSFGPAPPSGFQPVNPPTYYDIETTAQFEGSIEVRINYSGISFKNESNLKLFHFEDTDWVDRTSSLDTVNDIISASVESLSPFAIFELEGVKPIPATIDFDPDTLNLKSKGEWITCYIELPDGYDVGDINVNSIRLEEQDELVVKQSDVQDGVLMVKFDRQDVIAYIKSLNLKLPADVTLKVTGELKDGTPFEGSDTITIISQGGKGKPAPALLTFSLGQNFMNPFNPDTWIPYTLAKDVDVVIRIYSLSGQLVCTLDLGHQPAGRYVTKDKAAYWDGRDNFGEKVASGVYFYTLQAGEFKATRKMGILK